MPIHYSVGEPPRAVFDGSCAADEADGLLEWLIAAGARTDGAGADLSGCTVLHTALVQLVSAGHVRILAPPADPVLAACLRCAMPSHSSSQVTP